MYDKTPYASICACNRSPSHRLYAHLPPALKWAVPPPIATFSGPDWGVGISRSFTIATWQLDDEGRDDAVVRGPSEEGRLSA
jgi:hypothetical protein